MSVTETKTSQAPAEWLKVFPRQMTETYTSSVAFMKQLTTVAVSTITYLKNFPEENYHVENFGGIKLRILKKRCPDDLAQFVSTALTQAFEAFDKKYLQQLAICFYDGECNADNLIEYHIFEYSYNPNGVTMNVRSKNKEDKENIKKFTFKNIKEQTMRLIRACVVLTQEHQLPEYYDVSLRLYYNEDAPEGYQAPGFVSSTEAEDHLAPSREYSMSLGHVETPFHKMAARAYLKQDIFSADANIPSDNASITTQNQDFEDEYEASASGIRCACNKSDAERDEPLVTCNNCGTSQHAVCYGLSAPTPEHCCVRCTDSHPHLTPTDSNLAKFTDYRRESMCIFRRALWWCGSESHVSASSLAQKFSLTQRDAAKLFKLLISHGIFHDDDDTDLTKTKKLIPDQLKEVIGKSFRNKESDIVDRLLAETLSQNSQDPVGDVLGPIEKMTLQNASNLGKIVEPPQEKTITEDSTLKEYREAILSNEMIEDELPLSGSHNPVEDMKKIGKKSNKRKMNDENKPRPGGTIKRSKAMPK